VSEKVSKTHNANTHSICDSMQFPSSVSKPPLHLRTNIITNTANKVAVTSAIVATFTMVGLIQLCLAPVHIIAPVAAVVVVGHYTHCPTHKPQHTPRTLPGVLDESIEQCARQTNDQEKQGIFVKTKDVNQTSEYCGTRDIQVLPFLALVIGDDKILVSQEDE
jgi:hypothetical protein